MNTADHICAAEHWTAAAENRFNIYKPNEARAAAGIASAHALIASAMLAANANALTEQQKIGRQDPIPYDMP